MSIPKLSPFDLSSINDSDLKLGADGSEKTTFPIYIGQNNTGHVILLKPFLDSIKYNLTKELEYMSDKDKWEKVIKEYTGDFAINLDLKVPASSPEEARNNVGKIEHLQRMLLEPYSEIGVGINSDEKDPPIGPLFFVCFANLIFGSEIMLMEDSLEEVFQYGLSCTIKSISYSPDSKMGFFEFDSGGKEYLYPKLLNLSLTLNYENNNQSDKFQPIKGFTRQGKLIDGDEGYFPFDAGSYTYSQVAKIIKSEINYNARNYYVYLFRDNNTALFPAFIDDFSRDFEVDNNILESKSKYIGKGIDTGKFTTPQKLSYKVNFSVPCANVQQSKIFCSEISKLIRMFYRPQETDEAISRDPFKVYIPGFIEGSDDPQNFIDIIANVTSLAPSSPQVDQSILDLYGVSSIEELNQSLEAERINNQGAGDVSDLEQPQTQPVGFAELTVGDDNPPQSKPPGIYLFMEDLGVEMVDTMGFFEQSGHLYPKAFKITMNLTSDYSHKYESSIKPFKVEQDGTSSLEEELFPFNRKTFKIGE